MSALLIWVVVPAAAGLVIYALRRYDKATHLAGIGICLFLAWLAWRLPIDEPIALRLVSALSPLRISSVGVVLGGSFRLDNALRPALALLYLSAAFWFGGAYAARTHRLFTPIGLAIAALMTATLSAEQTSTSALLIELVALLCVPLLSAPGEKMRRGVLRFVVYQTGGVCLILFAEAAIAAGGRAGPGPEVASAFFTLLVGFSLLLAVIPFHTWMPMLAEEGNTYPALFVFYVIPAAVGILALRLLDRFAPTGLAPALVNMLRYAGMLMVLTGGLGAALERNLGRIAGFAALTQVGMGLLAISLNDQVGRVTPLVGVFFAQLVPQAIGLAVWGLALSILNRRVADLRFRTVQGVAHRLPLVTLALVLANLSLAGLPLLAGFPIYTALWAQISSRSLAATLLSLTGSLGLMVAALRSLAVLIMPSEAPASAEAGASAPLPAGSSALEANLAAASSKPPTWQISETRTQAFLLCAGVAALLLAGIFPQIYLPTLMNMAIQFAGP